MAPRAPETFRAFRARLLHAIGGGAREVRFGTPHATHAVCREEGAWRVRRLLLDPEDAKAYLRDHGSFMPEHAEEISRPGPDVLAEASSPEALCERLERLWVLEGLP